MKKFFYDMFSSRSSLSSKRILSAFTLLNIIILAYVATFRNDDHITPEFMFDALCLIAGGGLGLTVIEKILDKKKEVPVSVPVQPAPEPQLEINYDTPPTEETV
jgi:hypothetical protein